MKCSEMLLSTIMTVLCCSPVFAQTETKEDSDRPADTQAEVKLLEEYLRAARSKLATAEQELSIQKKAIAEAALKTSKAYKTAKEQAKMAGAEYYANARQNHLMEESVRVHAELARATQASGPQHPHVVALKKKLEILKGESDKATVPSVDPKQVKGQHPARVAALAKYKEQLAALKELEALMKKSAYKQQLHDHTTQIEKEREALETKLKLSLKGHVHDAQSVQSERLMQMRQMQERLKRAQELSLVLTDNRAAAKSLPLVESGQNVTKGQFDRLEQKLDKIASLLEKIIDRDKE